MGALCTPECEDLAGSAMEVKAWESSVQMVSLLVSNSGHITVGQAFHLIYLGSGDISRGQSVARGMTLWLLAQGLMLAVAQMAAGGSMSFQCSESRGL